jgi:hypothetical protein
VENASNVVDYTPDAVAIVGACRQAYRPEGGDPDTLKALERLIIEALESDDRAGRTILVDVDRGLDAERVRHVLDIAVENIPALVLYALAGVPTK